MVPSGDGYRQQGSSEEDWKLLESADMTLVFGPNCHFSDNLRANKSSRRSSGSRVLGILKISVGQQGERLVIAEGEVLVSGGESREDEGVDEGLRVVQSSQQGGEGGR